MVVLSQTKQHVRKRSGKRFLRLSLLHYSIGLSVLFALPAQGKTANVLGTVHSRKAAHHSFFQKGLASWYEGRKSGSYAKHNRLSKNNIENPAYTAAHPFLPFGTKLLVHSPVTGRSVVVVVNDRGPFIGKRIIDLSRAAAARLGMLQRGVTRVIITNYVPHNET